MKVLVIPDVHLKPWMFRSVERLMERNIADRVVCLMDIADDWNKGYDILLYEETYNEAIRFAEKYPETAWCYGNHDISYWWNKSESGYSNFAADTVRRKLLELRAAIPENNPIKYVQKIDNVLFAHGGVLDFFVQDCVSLEKYHDVEAVIEEINTLGSTEMWNNTSPIWLRPQGTNLKLYKSEELLQVVGHTPMSYIKREGNLVSCDVFSTYSSGKPVGTQEFLLLDTKTWEYQGIAANQEMT